MEQVKISDIKIKKPLFKKLKQSKVRFEMSKYKKLGQFHSVVLVKVKNKKYKVLKGSLMIEVVGGSGKNYVWANVIKDISKNNLQKVLQNRKSIVYL